MGYYNNLSIDTRTWGKAKEDTYFDRQDGMRVAAPVRTTLYCVVYRTGGTENFKWQRTLGMTKADAEAACENTRRMGYKAMVVNYLQSLSIGLPETYE